MANSKIIIVEGAQGAGKTTVTDYIRYSLKHTNLYRLSGTQDATPAGKQKAKEMYEDLLEYMKKLENKNINLLFDRTFFSEENYCRLGKKDYTFTDVYEKLLENLSKLDFEIYYITLYLKDENEYAERIKREGKVEPSYAKFSAQSSIDQQKTYLQMSEEVREKYPKIHTINLQNDRTLEEVQEEINQILKI
jgi:thymidylate kinase